MRDGIRERDSVRLDGTESVEPVKVKKLEQNQLP